MIRDIYILLSFKKDIDTQQMHGTRNQQLSLLTQAKVHFFYSIHEDS